MFVTSCHK
ncbi:hypothetical protein D047_3920A, partial [Vibrio parahaemolyticus VPTS-2010_2]